MLDKTSEKVLQYIIENHDTKNMLIIFDDTDTEKLMLSEGQLRAILRVLLENGYIFNYAEHYEFGSRAFLTQLGLNYFQSKGKEIFRFWFPIIITNLISIAALIVAILAYIKQ